MRIEADRSVCIGSGVCVITAPDVFDQDEVEGKVVLLQPEPGPDRIEDVRYAIKLCPSGALSAHPEDSVGRVAEATTEESTSDG